MKGYRSVRVAGAVFRLILTLGILAVVGIVVWRVFFSTKIPGEVRDLQKNDALTAAWETYGDNLTFRRQEQATITRGEHNNGYFSVVDCVFIPEAAQVQLVFRYNNGTWRGIISWIAFPPRGRSCLRSRFCAPPILRRRTRATTATPQRLQRSGFIRRPLSGRRLRSIPITGSCLTV